jgi:hypothetical protein
MIGGGWLLLPASELDEPLNQLQLRVQADMEEAANDRVELGFRPLSACSSSSDREVSLSAF